MLNKIQMMSVFLFEETTTTLFCIHFSVPLSSDLLKHMLSAH